MKLKSNHNLYKHICTVDNETADAFRTESHLTSFKRTLEIWKGNPNMKYFYFSLADMEKERRWLKESPYAWFIIHPFSFFRYIWEATALFFLIVGFVVMPFNLIYGPLVGFRCARLGFSNACEIWECICDWWYVLDFVLLFITGYPNPSEKKVYLTPRSIRRHYITSKEFCFDLIGLIHITTIVKIYLACSESVDNLDWIFYVKCISLLKLFRWVRFMIYYQNVTEFFSEYIFSRSAIKYTLLCLIIIHLLTCFYMMMKQYLLMFSKNAGDDIILHSFNYVLTINQGYLTMYTESHHMILSYLFCIRMDRSYGYITSFRHMWRFDVCVFMTLSTLGFIVTSIMSLLAIQMIMKLSDPEIKYHSVLNQVSHYTRTMKLPKVMNERIIYFYDYRFQKRFYKDSVIKNNLSDSLIRDIKVHVCEYLFDAVPVLKELPQEVRASLVSCLKYQLYLHNDVIVNAGATDKSMYFISKGSVCVTTPNGREICHLQDGAYFGEIALVMPDQKRIANVTAIEICEVYKLDQVNFLNFFDDSTQFFKRIEQTARSRLEKTVLLEELHHKYLIDRTTKRQFRGIMRTSDGVYTSEIRLPRLNV